MHRHARGHSGYNAALSTPSPPQPLVKISTVSGIDDINAQQWNALVRECYGDRQGDGASHCYSDGVRDRDDDGASHCYSDGDAYPFLRHEFLSAMEMHHCVGEHTGWIPRHLTCTDGDELLGVMPLYEKHNSWGEFVFDHAWAEAYRAAGLAYYPKLVNAIPFTPAGGGRVPTRAGDDGARRKIVRALSAGARALMERGGYSGVHSLFVGDDEFALLEDDAAVSRSDCQFHWRNCDYQTFDDFLATLKSKKRKNIRHERARVAQSGVVIRRLDGHTATADDWRNFCALYRAIYDRKYGYPAFNENFFRAVAAAMPDQVHLVVAELDGATVAGALMYSDARALYGRHWGCRGYVDSLHFEICYYQGIEICIERGLKVFDPGAQGEHKIARGFTPVRTRSLHWMAQSPFSGAIRQFAGRESDGVRQYIRAARRHSPYHLDGDGVHHRDRAVCDSTVTR